jgi:dihydrofolate reductase
MNDRLESEMGPAMRKVILMMSVSLDGFIDGADRELDWHMVDDTTLVREVVAEQFIELKGQSGGDLALGGVDLAAAFMRHDLIDEYRLYVHPIVIGRGKPLFQPSDPKIKLRLAETRTFGNGVVLLRYQRPDAPAKEISDSHASDHGESRLRDL